MEVPAVVREKALAAGAGAWLDALASLVAALAEEWALSVGAPFADATEAFVAAAVQADGTPCALELVVPREGEAAAREIAALRLAGGEGCARLLRDDVGRGALLLERLGRPLSALGLPVSERHEILVAAAARVWRPAAGEGFPTGAEKAAWLAEFVASMWEELDRPCSERAVEHALACAARRGAAHRDETAVLVHGDVHQWNALEADGGFKLVDPDGGSSRSRRTTSACDACRAATGRAGDARRGGTGRYIGFRCVVSSRCGFVKTSSGEQMKRGIGVVAALACVALSAAGSASAGEGVYYQDPVRADLPVSAPPTPSCTVSLATDYATNDAGGGYHDFNGTFAPPAGCPGPWAKVVLHFTAHEAGRQYDRAGEIAFGGAWIFFTSTPEPDPDGITWSVDKDVTEYSSLFTSGRPYTISVPNYLNSLITGVMHISASLTFYEPDAAHPAPAVPDAVVPLGTHYVSSGTPTNFTVSGLPRNIERAQLEVYPKGNSCDEFWYGGAPDAFAGANGLCGGGAYRELDAAVDGTPAGATLPFPDVFTGGVNPLIWRPIPAVDAFDLPPRTLDVTPFVGTLVDGGTHTISLAVANAQSYWGLTGNLLLWLDHGSPQTSGALVSDTLASGPAAAAVSEQPGTGSDVWHTTASRSWTISGRVQTSHGVVTTTVDGAFDFANGNDLTVQNYRQNTTNDQTLHSVVTTSDTTGTRRHAVDETDSIVAQDMFQEPPHADDWMLPAHVSVTKTVSVADTVDGAPAFSSSLTNTTAGSGVLSEFDSGLYRLANGADRQDYEYSDSTGVCYQHRISAAQGYVTSDHVDGTC